MRTHTTMAWVTKIAQTGREAGTVKAIRDWYHWRKGKRTLHAVATANANGSGTRTVYRVGGCVD